MQVYGEVLILYDWMLYFKVVCDEVGIYYFFLVYDFVVIDMFEFYVFVYKIGSGDVMWLEVIEYMVVKGKLMLVVIGVLLIQDVVVVVDVVYCYIDEFVFMQCNMNYIGSEDNFWYILLEVLCSYVVMFLNVVFGLFDYMLGYVMMFGVIVMGVCVIEKYFIDDIGCEGFDYGFLMDFVIWWEMVDWVCEFEVLFGQLVKCIEENEIEMVIVQCWVVCLC